MGIQAKSVEAVPKYEDSSGSPKEQFLRSYYRTVWLQRPDVVTTWLALESVLRLLRIVFLEKQTSFRHPKKHTPSSN